MITLQQKTSDDWAPLAVQNLDAVLQDHAHCEKKAAATAMSLVNIYPDRTLLVQRMIKLAQEELRHFAQVHRILQDRGVALVRDTGDPYAQELVKHARHGKVERLVDRLLIAGYIEARSCERLTLLSQALEDASLKQFYAQLATAEAGHQRLFYDLAREYGDESDVDARSAALGEIEAQLVSRLPVEARIH